MTTADYFQHFACPVCDNWIPCCNIAGECPHCGSAGFRTLKIKGVDNGKKEKV